MSPTTLEICAPHQGLCHPAAVCSRPPTLGPTTRLHNHAPIEGGGAVESLRRPRTSSLMAGYHGRGGRAPDPNALRRDRKDDRASWVTLPASGREGPPPEWPLSDPTARELVLWEREWRRPQAVVWEAFGLALEVALYVRTLVAAEGPKATAAQVLLVLRQQEHLGLSVPGLTRNRWRIGDDPAAPERGQPRSSSARPSARERLRAVDSEGSR